MLQPLAASLHLGPCCNGVAQFRSGSQHQQISWCFVHDSCRGTDRRCLHESECSCRFEHMYSCTCQCWEHWQVWASSPQALRTLCIRTTVPAIIIVGSQHRRIGNLRLVTTICTVYWRVMTVVITVSRKELFIFSTIIIAGTAHSSSQSLRYHHSHKVCMLLLRPCTWPGWTARRYSAPCAGQSAPLLPASIGALSYTMIQASGWYL